MQVCCLQNILNKFGDPGNDQLTTLRYDFKRLKRQKRQDVASDVGVNFKNVGVLSIENSLFHLFHYTFLQTKHQRKGY